MNLDGEFHIDAPRETVWRALNSTDVLRICIPGCEELERLSETELKAIVVMKIGPVKVRFNGQVRLENLRPPESYDILGEGQGGVAGFARGGANVQLKEADGGTILTYQAKAEVGGKIAQLGSRLIKSTAAKLAKKFFAKFSEMLNEKATE